MHRRSSLSRLHIAVARVIILTALHVIASTHDVTHYGTLFTALLTLQVPKYFSRDPKYGTLQCSMNLVKTRFSQFFCFAAAAETCTTQETVDYRFMSRQASTVKRCHCRLVNWNPVEPDTSSPSVMHLSKDCLIHTRAWTLFSRISSLQTYIT